MVRQSLICKIILSFILAFCITTSYAQRDTFIFTNDSNVDVDESIVEAAAQSLMSGHGARVAIYIVVTGNKRDFTQRLNEDGLDTTIMGRKSDLFAIYIATEEQYSEIRWGSDFDRIDGGRIRREALNPSLRERAFSDALVNTLNEVEAELSNPLISIGHFIVRLLGNEVFLIFCFIFILGYIANKMGWQGSGDSSYDDNSSSWSSFSSDSGSSSSYDSGGGSDGGSWDD